jgi:subtilisin family serine protease
MTNHFYTKIFSLILFLAIASTSFSQGLGLDKALREQADQVMPFSLNNTPENRALLNIEDVYIKLETENYLFVSVTPNWLKSQIDAGKLKDFYLSYAPPSLMNDTARAHHFVDGVHAGAGGLPTGYTGKGVIMGVVDTGLDFNHPDFRDSNDNSRVLYYWDHEITNGNNPPQPYNYGQEWTAADIANGSVTSNLNQAHGSTVAGSAAGNGRANGTNTGMAPDADIIVIQTNFNLPNWTNSILDACDYVFKKADALGMPAVVNLSLGSYWGSHDGNDPAAQGIEALLDAKTGRIVVCAAGNSGNWGAYHVKGIASADTTFTWLKNNPSGSQGANTILFDVWMDALTAQTMKFGFGADKITNGYSFRGQSRHHAMLEDIAGPQPFRDTIYNSAGQQIARVETYRGYEGSNFNLISVIRVDSTNYNFRFMTSGSGTYDLWSGTQVGGNQLETNIPTAIEMPEIIHYQTPDTLSTLVSSWNCSPKVISVGNFRNRAGHIDKNYNAYGYDYPVGKLAKSSSKGPTRQGSMKPDVAAAGEVALSAGPLSLLNNPASNSAIDSSGWHVRNGGTSMASPIVAGIAALYLERCSKGTYSSFKNLLTSTAYADSWTGTLPNYGFGFGKAHALDLMTAITIEPKPSITQDDDMLTSSSAPNYQWLEDLTELPGQTTQFLNITPPNSDYQVYTVSNDGCVSTSDVHSSNLGLKETNEHGVILVPNPAKTQVVIMAKTPFDDVKCFNNAGMEVHLPKIGKDTYDVSHLAVGYYQIKVISVESVLQIKMLRID